MLRNKENGFTLLELTVALAVVGLIALAVASSLGAVSSAWERGERRLAAREDIRVPLQRLGMELAALSRGAFGGQPGLTGDASGFCFTTAGPYGPCRLRIKVEQDRLVMLEDHPRLPSTEAKTIVLTHAVEYLECSYYDPASARWLDRWLAGENQGPPVLVRLNIQMKNKTAPLEMVFPVYAGRTMGAQGVEPAE